MNKLINQVLLQRLSSPAVIPNMQIMRLCTENFTNIEIVRRIYSKTCESKILISCIIFVKHPLNYSTLTITDACQKF